MRAREFYNKTAEFYDKRLDASTGKWIERHENKLIKKFSHGKILDLGCGTCRHLPGAVGIDVSEEMLKFAKGRMTVVQADAEEIPFKNSTFDTVLCFKGVLSMCDGKKAAEGVSRVLRPGGRAIMSVASIWDTFTKLSDKKKAKNPPKTKKLRVNKCTLELYLLTKTELVELFKKNGMDLEHFSSVFVRQNPQWGKWKISLKERAGLFLERLMPDNEYGAMYLAVFRKT